MKINKNLVKGSIVLILASGIYNLFNFIFQLSMARMLDILDYGMLATIFSFIYILSVFSESIQIVIARYCSSDLEAGEIKNILKKSIKKSFYFSSIVFVAFLFISILLSRILKIPYFLLSLSGIIIFSSFLIPVVRGGMQGRKKFTSLGLNMVSESLVKLIFSILFVIIGFKVYGAIFGTLIGFLVSFVFAFYPLRNIFTAKEKVAKTLGIYDYARPAFFITLITIIFYSIDIIIARIVFSPEISAMYAISSILSKSIFWGTNPINKVMFPLSVENREKNKKEEVFLNAFIIVAVLIGISLAAFYFFPSLIVKIFSGKNVAESISILFYLGVGTSLISIANLVLTYKLSLGKTNKYYYFIIFAIIEIVMLFYFSHNLIEFSLAFITSSSLFLFGSIFLMNE